MSGKEGEQHLGLGVDMLCGAAGSKLKHSHALRGVDTGPQLADTQALLVNVVACQSACTSNNRYQHLLGGTAVAG